jgi:hypothetical protein
MGRAFCHWIERIPTDGLPTTGGTPATLTVNLDYDAVAGQVRQAAGMLATGVRISASEVRRLACSHGILPRVLDGGCGLAQGPFLSPPLGAAEADALLLNVGLLGAPLPPVGSPADVEPRSDPDRVAGPPPGGGADAGAG